MPRVREYGSSGPLVYVLHGGPGAPGSMAPIARGLADRFRVREPFQRRAGGAPLTVERHVDDLLALIGPDERPALVGSSWGAMLALAAAARAPRRTGPLVLIGCGTFDPAARSALEANLAERVDATLRARLERLPREIADPDLRLRRCAELLLPAYAVDPVTADLEIEDVDARGHRETWADALRLQETGAHPAAFAAIEAPVLMLHGDRDPHPGRLVRDGLRPFVRELEYRELDRCGHYPWLERAARDELFATLRAWLDRRLREGRGPTLR